MRKKKKLNVRESIQFEILIPFQFKWWEHRRKHSDTVPAGPSSLWWFGPLLGPLYHSAVLTGITHSSQCFLSESSNLLFWSKHPKNWSLIRIKYLFLGLMSILWWFNWKCSAAGSYTCFCTSELQLKNVQVVPHLQISCNTFCVFMLMETVLKWALLAYQKVFTPLWHQIYEVYLNVPCWWWISWSFRFWKSTCKA